MIIRSFTGAIFSADELREDGAIELREDGYVELREADTALISNGDELREDSGHELREDSGMELRETAVFINPAYSVIGWQNLITRANITATSEDIDFPAINLANPSIYAAWKAGAILSPPSYSLTVDVLSSDVVDYVAFAGHNFGSGGFTVQISDGSSPIIQSAVLLDDKPLIFQFSPRTGLGAIVINLFNGSLLPKIGACYVGKLLTMERSIVAANDHNPIGLTFENKTQILRSESGQYLGQAVLTRKGLSKAVYEWLTPDWYRTNFSPFKNAAETAPFFFAWQPQAYIFEVGFVQTTDDIIAEIDPVTRRVMATIPMQGLS